MWWSRRAILVHLAGVVVVGGCLALGYWQYLRATGGNTLSWAYVFEWPIFAGFAAYLWWDLVHHPHRERPVEPPAQVLPPGWTKPAALGGSAYAGTLGTARRALGDRTQGAPGDEGRGEVVPTPSGVEVFSPEDPVSLDPKERQERERLAAYNRYLAELSANGKPKRW